jgi:methionyl-tRNA formyltransferase
MNLIFCGSPEFAVPTLDKLLTENFNIDLVVTNPNEPVGRGYKKSSLPVKRAAEKAGLKIFQPAKLRDPVTERHLSIFHPDAIVVVAYGHIIPPWMIALPRLGCINLHASLLPKYRGAAPIQWALIQGERVTGVTTMKIDPGLDTGDILLQREIEIRDEDTTESLAERLSWLGAELMIETLRGLGRGEIVPRPQDSGLATFAPVLKKEDGRINWSLPADAIARRVRGLRPWPGAYTSFRGKNLRIWSAAPASGAVGAQGLAPLQTQLGALIPERGTLFVSCGDATWLETKELQLEGRNRMPAPDFLNGIRLAPGEKLA